MCQRPAPQKMLCCRRGSQFFDHDLAGFGALPFFWVADRAKTSRGGIPSLRICLCISTRQLDFFWTGAAALSSPSLSHDVGPRLWPQILTASHGFWKIPAALELKRAKSTCLAQRVETLSGTQLFLHRGAILLNLRGDVIKPQIFSRCRAAALAVSSDRGARSWK